MAIRTDLAKELPQIEGGKIPLGVSKHVETIKDIEITKITVLDDTGSELLGKPKGDYITIEPPQLKIITENFETLVEVVSKQIKNLLPQTLDNVMVIGLGNRDITPDALGPCSIGHTLATRHIMGDFSKSIGLDSLKSVSAIATGVLGQTGIESSEIIKAIAKQISPNVIIVIDAFACKSLSRLGNTIQISNTGISPGSGVQNARAEISEQSIGIPVISIGVPMVVDLHTIASEYVQDENIDICKNANMMVTPREIDVIIEHASKVVGYAINLALQPSLGFDDIVGLVG